MTAVTATTTTPTHRRRALLAGLSYYVTHITSVAAAIIFVGAFAQHDLARQASPLILAVALEVILALGCLATGVLLLPILLPHGAAAAYAFSAMRTMEAAVIAAGTVPVLGALWWAQRAAPGEVPSSLVTALESIHDAGFLVGQGLIISVNSIVIGWLLWRSGLVPRGIGLLGMTGGAVVLVGNALQLTGAIEFGGTIAGAMAAPIFAFEIWFASYLVFVGVRNVQGTSAREAVA